MVRFEQEDNKEKGRFIMYENEVLAGEITYTWSGETKFIIDHTSVDPEFSGKGFGKQLVIKAVEFAKNNNLKVVPRCPYAKKVFDRNVDLQQVLSH
ncbi:GNAT family N-acetyltransferase [Maribacter polysaccharolyticus]|uniref:GNAT family N-acetyltransferase n=1 Tax=Maribacter polysaccharolyticus TaxID=3020831 RepID=UPI00237F7DDC|nr:GNAT family N-acetyltransferase [Maribacter polysaccharolyticus]MDE3743827.1 GNAT family N-acetyltransferase [Maribacter polysaccharolyticus]